MLGDIADVHKISLFNQGDNNYIIICIKTKKKSYVCDVC